MPEGFRFNGDDLRRDAREREQYHQEENHKLNLTRLEHEKKIKFFQQSINEIMDASIIPPKNPGDPVIQIGPDTGYRISLLAEQKKRYENGITDRDIASEKLYKLIEKTIQKLIPETTEPKNKKNFFSFLTK